MPKVEKVMLTIDGGILFSSKDPVSMLHLLHYDIISAPEGSREFLRPSQPAGNRASDSASVLSHYSIGTSTQLPALMVRRPQDHCEINVRCGSIAEVMKQNGDGLAEVTIICQYLRKT